MIDGVSNSLELILLAGTVVGGGWGWVKKIKPWRRERAKAAAEKERDRSAARDALIGRPPVLDSITGKELAPALPGIGQRMATQEQQMADMASSVAQIAETQAELARVHITLEGHGRTLDRHGGRLDTHDGRLDKLEEAAVERVVSKAESAAAWRAMEAAALSKPDEEADPTSV